MGPIENAIHMEDKLAQCGGTLKLRLADSKTCPWDEEDSHYHPHYRCTLKGPGGSYTFDFWDSNAAGETGTAANEYDVLAGLVWTCSDTFEEFCAEFGYSPDSIKAHRTWTACLRQSRALKRCFPSETARQTLAEIQ